MHPAAFTHILILIIAAVSILLMLVRPRRIAEVYWVGAGALVLVAFRLMPVWAAWHAIGEGADVYLFLIGMMLLSELAREQGVFGWLASVAVGHSRRSCARLFLLVYIIGTLVTVFMSNDATAVVLTPAILAAVRKAKTPALPYLFACAFIANAASFVLPISNPANLVVFHRGMPALGHWMAAFAFPSALSIGVTYAVLRYVFRDPLEQCEGATVPEHRLTANGGIVLAGVALVVAVLLTCSAHEIDLGLPTCATALFITAVVCIKAKANPWKLAREISWSTLALVGALFILVDAVESTGALIYAQIALRWAEHLPAIAGAITTSFAVGIANNLINNLPLGLIASSTLAATHASPLITNLTLIGVDLGPNLSVTGSLATILWLIALRREGLDVSALDFLKVGALAMPAALLAATLGEVAMHVLGMQ